jgi:hypothetical protein
MRTDDVLGMLDYLAHGSSRNFPFERVRQGLEIMDAAEGRQRVRTTYDAIVQRLNP